VLLRPEQRRLLLDYKIVSAYMAGTTSGAFFTALTAWFLSGFAELLMPSLRVGLICLGAAFIWLVKQGPLGQWLSLPESRRQIPAEVFGGGLVRGAYRFGLELGTGFRTYVPSPAPYVVLLTLLLGQLTLGAALVIGLGFGLGRALPLMAQVSFASRERVTNHFLLDNARFAPNLATLLVFIGGLCLVGSRLHTAGG
jgi:hypothetical protein